MAKNSLFNLLALLAALVVVAAGCTTSGSDTASDRSSADSAGAEAATTATDTAGETVTDADTETEDEAAGASTDGVLTVGSITPRTGDRAPVGPPQIAGLRLARDDINAAGGVLGQNIVLIEGDSGDTNIDIANPSVDGQLANGADVIIDAATSTISRRVMAKITGAGVIQFSTATSSASFTAPNNSGLHFQAVPSYLLQGRVLANLVADDGAATMSIIYPQEQHGEELAKAIQENFEAVGGMIDEVLPYAADTEIFDAEVVNVVAADSDAIVIVSFSDYANILTALHDGGVGPTDKAVYGADGWIDGAAISDISILEGLRRIEPSVDLTTISSFIDRLDGAYGEPVMVTAFGAETYDAVVITALAAEIAGTDDPIEVAAQINDITRGGKKCTTFAECKAIIEAGGDPDYDGIGGAYEFVDAGEPAAASFRIITYGPDGIDNAADVYVAAS